MLKGRDISEVVDIMLCSGNTYNRRILRFFRWFCKWIPISIMLSHWYCLYVFSKHPKEMFVIDNDNTVCYLWMYFMAYILPMVIIAASRFFLKAGIEYFFHDEDAPSDKVWRYFTAMDE